MPGRSTHIGVAVLSAGAFAFFWSSGMDSFRRVTVVLAASTTGAIGGALPDVLEPALHPHHRQFFHSVTFAAGLGTLQVKQVGGWLRECRARGDGYWFQSQSVGLTETQIAALRDQATGWDALAGALIGLMIGYGSHLILDGVTPRGLPEW